MHSSNAHAERLANIDAALVELKQSKDGSDNNTPQTRKAAIENAFRIAEAEADRLVHPDGSDHPSPPHSSSTGRSVLIHSNEPLVDRPEFSITGPPHMTPQQLNDLNAKYRKAHHDEVKMAHGRLSLVEEYASDMSISAASSRAQSEDPNEQLVYPPSPVPEIQDDPLDIYTQLLAQGVFEGISPEPLAVIYDTPEGRIVTPPGAEAPVYDTAFPPTTVYAPVQPSAKDVHDEINQRSLLRHAAQERLNSIRGTPPQTPTTPKKTVLFTKEELNQLMTTEQEFQLLQGYVNHEGMDLLDVFHDERNCLADLHDVAQDLTNTRKFFDQAHESLRKMGNALTFAEDNLVRHSFRHTDAQRKTFRRLCKEHDIANALYPLIQQHRAVHHPHKGMWAQSKGKERAHPYAPKKASPLSSPPKTASPSKTPSPPKSVNSDHSTPTSPTNSSAMVTDSLFKEMNVTAYKAAPKKFTTTPPYNNPFLGMTKEQRLKKVRAIRAQNALERHRSPSPAPSTVALPTFVQPPLAKAPANVTCHLCGKFGHKKVGCPRYVCKFCNRTGQGHTLDKCPYNPKNDDFYTRPGPPDNYYDDIDDAAIANITGEPYGTNN